MCICACCKAAVGDRRAFLGITEAAFRDRVRSSERVVSEKRVEMSDGEEQVCLNVRVRSGDRFVMVSLSVYFSSHNAGIQPGLCNQCLLSFLPALKCRKNCLKQEKKRLFKLAEVTARPCPW